MLIHVKPKEKPEQVMSLEKINSKLNSGEFDGDELGWKAGLAEWTSLRNIEGVVFPTPPPLPDEVDDTNREQNIFENVYGKATPDSKTIIPMQGTTNDNPKKCPQCKLINPPSAHRCDCGYDFIKGQMGKSFDPLHVDQSRMFLGGTTHPWRRFFARTIDEVALGLALSIGLVFCVNLLFPENAAKFSEAIENPIIAVIIICLLWIPCEAMFLTFTGTTPAKWIFGIRVLTSSGSKLSFGSALQRTILVLIQGEGLGIPGVILFTRIFAYRRLAKTGTTHWDTSMNSVVTHRRWGFFRALFCVSAVIAVFTLVGILNAIVNQN